MTKKLLKNQSVVHNESALSLLDDLIQRYYQALLGNVNKTAKLGDWLKMIELRRKLQPDESPSSELWKKLEKIRRELLADKPTKHGPKSGLLKGNGKKSK